MEEKLQLRAPLGSKLPKFGTSKPVGSILQQAHNGTYNGMPAKGNHVNEKHSELDRTIFSFSRSKLKYPQNDQIPRTSPNIGIQKTISPFQTMVQNGGSRSGVTKVGKQSNMLLPHKEALNENLLSSSNKFTKATQFGRTSYSSLNEPKPPANGFCVSKPPTGLYRPRANSATNRNFTNNVLSSDNKPFFGVRRSQSFSNTVQNPQFPSATLTRSYSLHRDTDFTKANQLQHASTRTNLLRPRFQKQYGLQNGNESHLKTVFTRPNAAVLNTALKKPISNIGLAAPSSLGYKMTRPSLQKTIRSPISDSSKDSPVTILNSKIDLISNGTCPETNKTNTLEDQDLGFDHYTSSDHLDRQDFKDRYFSEDVDELSISSLSSSDKNDFSEDFSDDFLDLEEKPEKAFPEKPSLYSLTQEGKQNSSRKCDEWIDMNITDLKDGNKAVIVVEPEKTLAEEQSIYSLGEGQSKKPCSSSSSDDWLDVNISVQNEADPKGRSYAESVISPDMEYRDPSSLELSPSDSSGGTYMWDEEGMEPIGNVHQCESYESSEMNSLDILNNIETCDLEEDDLMLDVEIPEDPPCDLGEGENMSRFDRSERNLRQQQLFWKRNPPRLNGQEQYHLSNPEHYHNGRESACLESPSDKKDSYGSPYCSPLSPRSPQTIGLHENTVMLDEMTLRHMVQDCTSVKTQLLKIKRLLQQGEDPESPVTDLQLSFPTTPDQVEPEPLFKTADLLGEIALLKEESRKKDDMIKQLQEKLKTRCKCQKEEPKAEKPKQHEKFTQTTWRRSSPHILQCSSNTLNSTDHHTGKLAAHQSIGVQNESLEQTQQSTSYNQNEDSNASSIIPENELSDLLSMRLKINDGEDKPEDGRQEKGKNQAQFDENKNVRPQELPSNSAPNNLDNQQMDEKSTKIENIPKTPLSEQSHSPKTLQLPKSKRLNAFMHPSTLVSPKSCFTLTSKISACSPLQQEVFHTKSKPQIIQNTSPLHQASVCVSPQYNSSRLDQLSSIVGQSTKTITDTKPLMNSSSPTHNLLTDRHLQTPAAELSKPISKLMPKGSLLKAPSHLTSKLKAPNISKSDLPTQDVSKEPQKPPSKVPLSAIPRTLSQKKDGVREADASSIPKRLSRLPQPKTH